MIFQNFLPTDIVSGRIQTVTTGLWSNGEPIAYEFYTSSAQTIPANPCTPFQVYNGAYYLNVYDLNPATDVSATVQFAIAYGNLNGGGALGLSSQNLQSGSTGVSIANYNTYVNILLNPGTTVFTFPTTSSLGFNSDDIYVMNFSTLAYKDQLDAGIIEFHMSGSNGIFSFIDNSFYVNNTTTTNNNSGQVYNIVSGTIQNGITQNFDTLSGTSYGLFYPDVGIIVLNPTAIKNTVGAELAPNTNTDAYYQNQNKIYTSLNLGGYFAARSSEYIPTTNYFVRIGNQNFNYSNNPTFVSGSNGNLLFSDFSSDPHVYVTTVGLYDVNNNLLAVAKLSNPQVKTFDNEILVKCVLNF